MIRRTTILLVVAIAAASPTGAAPRSAAAQPASGNDDPARAAAREHFALGVRRYEVADYRGALEAFQEAYRLAPHPAVRVNMANCYEQLGRPLEALHHFERFLTENDAATPEQQREVRAAIDRLQTQLGALHLAIAPDGASVAIDSTETRRAPILEPVRLAAGTHHITVRLDGYRTVHREVEIQGGGEQSLSIRLEREEERDGAVTSAEAAPGSNHGDTPAVRGHERLDESLDQGSTSREGAGFELRITTPVIIAGAVTEAFLHATLATGIIALHYNSEFESAVARAHDDRLTAARRNQARQEGLSAAHMANTMSIVSDIFLGATLAGAALTAMLAILEGSQGNSDDTPTGFELRSAPAVGSQGGGWHLTGRF